MDLYSRKIVAWQVYDCESGELASIMQIFFCKIVVKSDLLFDPPIAVSDLSSAPLCDNFVPG
jgi:hypothetical protein